MTDRHAYLIIAHTNFRQLSKLLRLLDNVRNDIYLLVDKKAKNWDKDEIIRQVKMSRLCFVKPLSISWGGDSQIKAEIRLLQIAVQENHQYYHLISGMDLPIKSQQFIFDFFDKNDGENFVSIDAGLNNDNERTEQCIDRVDYYYCFQNIITRKPGIISDKCYRLQTLLLRAQKKMNIHRHKNSKTKIVKGCNWFSITHEAARYVVDVYHNYKRAFKYTICADEIVVQTILFNSVFRNTMNNNTLRLIDWKRGSPYVFRKEDYDILMASGQDKLFARKFDERVDSEIIIEIFNELSNDNR